jgi:hypothetical protein
MQKYPDVVLNNPVIVQPAVVSSVFHVIQIAENPNEKWVNAFVSDGVRQIWIPILTEENYFSDWNDVDVTNAITDYVLKNYNQS